LFAKLADRGSDFFRLPFFLALEKGVDSGLSMARMKAAPPGRLEFGRERADEKGTRAHGCGAGHETCVR
jgi:hypothetical protein